MTTVQIVPTKFAKVESVLLIRPGSSTLPCSIIIYRHREDRFPLAVDGKHGGVLT